MYLPTAPGKVNEDTSCRHASPIRQHSQRVHLKRKKRKRKKERIKKRKMS
jgi:hypothetical protein